MMQSVVVDAHQLLYLPQRRGVKRNADIGRFTKRPSVGNDDI